MNKIIFILTLSAFLFSQQASVENIQVAQRTDGSKLVDITYDLLPDALFIEFNVTVEASLDEGDTWNQIYFLQGHSGIGQYAGENKSIIWNMGGEYSNTFSENVQIRVIADGNITPPPPFEMTIIPAGEYTYGEFDEIKTIDYDYEIGKYEITNAQYASYLIGELSNGNIYLDDGYVLGYFTGNEIFPAGNKVFMDANEYNGNFNIGKIIWNGTTFIVPEGYGDHPVVYVTLFGANAFAEFYGMRLPDAYEWEKAARGNTGYSYTWGDGWPNCDFDSDGNGANHAPNWEPCFDGTSAVGAYYNSISPYGTFDMIGNVGEIVTTAPENNPNSHYFLGGSYAIHQFYCRTWSRFNNSVGASSSSYEVGFRVVKTLN